MIKIHPCPILCPWYQTPHKSKSKIIMYIVTRTAVWKRKSHHTASCIALRHPRRAQFVGGIQVSYGGKKPSSRMLSSAFRPLLGNKPDTSIFAGSALKGLGLTASAGCTSTIQRPLSSLIGGQSPPAQAARVFAAAGKWRRRR